jgi:hypothetical protein
MSDIRTTRVAGPAPPAPRCADCGSALPPAARFCPSCGATAGVMGPAPETPVALGYRSGFRFGVGFSIGAGLVGLIAGFIGYVIAGWLIGSIITSIASVTSTPQRFEGSGSATSGILRLSGDTTVDWSAAPIDGTSCRVQGVLARQASSLHSQVIVDREVTTPTEATYSLPSLLPDGYVLTVASTCQWSFRFHSAS